ncbi:hypothetical protein [Oceanivirga miroungae]|uniref:Uncharacterized protein n=1 Tax=Oceanivirga miroungae TaxID=1130046 RepID=A0A6I8MBU1_9FUSO|nr:hypothetical protein [Oceanivirga miroungae]VWL84957.1 hypothetical protein OMES3154_00229 [Oceanivirga miroungae]
MEKNKIKIIFDWNIIKSIELGNEKLIKKIYEFKLENNIDIFMLDLYFQDLNNDIVYKYNYKIEKDLKFIYNFFKGNYYSTYLDKIKKIKDIKELKDEYKIIFLEYKKNLENIIKQVQCLINLPNLDKVLSSDEIKKISELKDKKNCEKIIKKILLYFRERTCTNKLDTKVKNQIY